ncbi:SsrA-binding protein SmpB, partial [Thermodesulfobacteriota bacterium]
KKIVCQNKKASHDYFIDEVLEAGIVLLGPEVKSLRDGRASLTDGYARVKNGEVFIHNMHITPYPFAHYLNLEPKRARKLLLNKMEIKRLIGKTKTKGYSLIPLKVYFSGSYAKVEIGLAKGKKKVDKRHSLREKEMKREMDQVRNRRGH